LLTAYSIDHTGFPSVTGYVATFAASAIGALVGAIGALFVTPLRLARPGAFGLSRAG
jgi:hypothetical protein